MCGLTQKAFAWCVALGLTAVLAVLAPAYAQEKKADEGKAPDKKAEQKKADDKKSEKDSAEVKELEARLKSLREEMMETGKKLLKAKGIEAPKGPWGFGGPFAWGASGGKKFGPPAFGGFGKKDDGKPGPRPEFGKKGDGKRGPGPGFGKFGPPHRKGFGGPPAFGRGRPGFGGFDRRPGGDRSGDLERRVERLQDEVDALRRQMRGRR